MSSYDELLRLREFAAGFRAWQGEITNVSFRAMLIKLQAAESARPATEGNAMAQN